MKFRDLPTAVAGRQMILLFDSNRLEGLVAIERSKVASALAQILMQAAGVRVEELDDDEFLSRSRQQFSSARRLSMCANHPSPRCRPTWRANDANMTWSTLPASVGSWMST